MAGTILAPISTFAGAKDFRTSDDAGGPAYAWTSIVSTGTLLSLVPDTYGEIISVDLENFVFPFYGVNYSAIWVTKYGHVSMAEFGPTVPSPMKNYWKYLYDGNETDVYDAPDIAVYGESFVNDNGIYAQEFSDHLVVQWNDIRYSGGSAGSSHYNFQCILWQNGLIQLVYETLTPKSGGSLNGLVLTQKDGDYVNGGHSFDDYIRPLTIQDGDAGVIHSNMVIEIQPRI